ncbi:hypothetical protein ACQ4PT_024914 [Festuca glaucescens]
MMSGGSGAGPSSSSFERHTKRRPPAPDSERRKLLRLSSVQEEDVLAAGVVPPVTVVLDGRCICHRVHLSTHTGYRSLAAALRRMFVDDDADGAQAAGGEGLQLDLSNAVPGHVVAYEDMEDDLLLAGDLNWKDFVRVAKRIRIIPAKPSNRRIKQ